MRNLTISFEKGEIVYNLTMPDVIEEKEYPEKDFAHIIGKTIVESSSLRVDLVVEHLKRLFKIE